MAIKALNPFAPKWYTPEQENKDDDTKATAFHICGLNGEQKNMIEEHLLFTDDGKLRGMTAKGISLALEYGLRGWRNFSNDSGELKFDPKNFRWIPSEIRLDLAVEIFLASQVSGEERKN